MISGATRVAAVIGDPVEHSLSPAIHNAAFASAGLDWVFVASRVRPVDLPAAIAGARALGVAGLSVTMPHKRAVVGLLDRLSPAATTVGAVNCIARDGTDLVGHNTDGLGTVAAVREAGRDPAGARCLVLGAGGAARAVVLALAEAGAAEVAVWARRPEAAEAAASLAGRAGRAIGDARSAGFDLVVNATALGMRDGDPSPLPEAPGAGQTLAELVYAAGPTRLASEARARGGTVVDGTGPLVHQAALAFSIWTGSKAPIRAMKSVLPDTKGRVGTVR